MEILLFLVRCLNQKLYYPKILRQFGQQGEKKFVSIIHFLKMACLKLAWNGMQWSKIPTSHSAKISFQNVSKPIDLVSSWTKKKFFQL